MPRHIVVDPGFGAELRRLREAHGLSVRELAARAYVSKSTISDLENSVKSPTLETAHALDQALQSRAALVGMVSEVEPAASLPPNNPFQTAELLDRVRASDVPTGTLEGLHMTVFDLCCAYGWQDASRLRAEGVRWLREVERLLRRPVGLSQHQELLTVAGWLALLVGCVEYDLGMRTAAEATRVAALQLAGEGGNSEIAAWGWEMSAWFALTQARFRDVVHAAQAGQAVIGDHVAAVQLIAQEAKARARMGDAQGAHAAMERGRRLLDHFPSPSRPDHHFIVDPDKWDFYAMDTYRLSGDDDRAQIHAEQVLRLGVAPDGTERAPMRMAEARLTLGTVAARAGELEHATDLAHEAFGARRRSLPSLLMVAREMGGELQRHDPAGQPVREFREAMQELSAD